MKSGNRIAAQPSYSLIISQLTNGKFNENSDIDVAIIKDVLDENYWELSKKLNKLTRNVDNRIEPVLLNRNDDRSGFLTTIMQTGIELA